jgi:hypothetical protein
VSYAIQSRHSYSFGSFRPDLRIKTNLEQSFWHKDTLKTISLYHFLSSFFFLFFLQTRSCHDCCLYVYRAAFQYGVKMSDGRKTRRAGPKDEKAKLDRELQQINRIIEKRKVVGGDDGGGKKPKY